MLYEVITVFGDGDSEAAEHLEGQAQVQLADRREVRPADDAVHDQPSYNFV